MTFMGTEPTMDLAEPPLGAGRVPLSLAAARVAGQLKRRPLSVGMLLALARLADFASLAGAGLLILTLYVGGVHDDLGYHYTLPLVLVPLATVALIGSFNGYALGAYHRFVPQIGKTVGLWAAVFGCFTLAVFFLKAGEDFSRVWLGTWFLAGLAILAANRAMLAHVVRRWTRAGILERRAVLVGGGKEAMELIRALEADREFDIRICGIFDDRDGHRAPAVNENYPRLGRIDELVEFGRQAEIDMLIVALPISAKQRLAELLKKLWVLPVDIRLSMQSSRLRFRRRSYSFSGSVPFLDVFDKPIADWDSIIKRAFDIVVGSAALILLSPLMLATALAVKLDSPGPVLFRQKRYGFNNELIELFKFRSMYVDQTDAMASRLVTAGDPRVTRVGRFIRRTSIDELPQLLNVVLQGNISLVGPRPHALKAKAANRYYEQVVDDYFARHRVKPGITGWAQVNGWRGETDTEEKIQRRVEHDLYYIENWSLLFDIYILFLTPIKLFNTENAY